MRSREEMIKDGCNPYDVDRVIRTQKIYDFAFSLVEEQMPKAPDYLKRAITRELLIEAVNGRTCS